MMHNPSPPSGAYAPLDPDLIRREIPESMQSATRWLVWKAVQKPGAKKPSKIPHYCDGNPRRGALDTAQDLARLAPLETALAVYVSGEWAGIGFALGPDGSGSVWQGCDFDDLGAHPDFQHLAESSGGYVEWSPSGNGLHAIGRGVPFAALGANTSGLEAYCAGRYFAVTGMSLGGDPIDLAPYVARVLAPRHGQGATDCGAMGGHSVPPPARPAEGFFAKVNLKALQALPAWVPALFPMAKPYSNSAGAGYRVSSQALGRDLQEDLAIMPLGIRDWGEERGKTPIDLVIEWGPGSDAPGAALWLCQRMGVDPKALGWSGAAKAERPPHPADAQGPAGSPPEKPALRVVGGTEHDARPMIQIEARYLPQNTDAAERALLDSGLHIFQHGGRLIRVGTWKVPFSFITRPVGTGVLIDISPEWLTENLTRCIRWERFDARRGAWVTTKAPSEISRTLLARLGEWKFPYLLGFSDSPTLDATGRLISAQGYDPGSGLFLVDPPAIEPIGRVTREDAQHASRELFALFDTFPFVTPEDKSALLAMVLTALLRRILPSAPISCISASTPGTGKSLLVDCISAILTGRVASVATIGQDAEELEKRLDTILLHGDAVMVFDNVDRAVKSDVLCVVATQAHKSVRVLGQSRKIEAPTNLFLAMTGNNLTLLGDLTRRVLVCRLDAGCERPELRVFERDAVETVLESRGDAIRDALTISMAYLQAGAPKVDAAPFGSFELWDRMIRRPLIWAGWPDPLVPAGTMREMDHEFGGMLDLLQAWHGVFGSNPMTAGDLYEAITARGGGMSHDAPLYPDLQEAAISVMGALGKWSPKELGYRLRMWSGRIIQGYRLGSGAKGKAGVRWVVEMVTNPGGGMSGKG